MSYWFKNREVDDDRIFATISAPSLYRTEKNSDAFSGDESHGTGDRIRSVNASGSSYGNDRERNNNEKKRSSDSQDASDVENENKKIQILEMPAIEGLTISSTFEIELLSNLENLSLNSDNETLNRIADLSLRDQKLLAGVVTSVAKVIGLIIVKPSKPHDVLLYIGSPVFFGNPNSSQVSEDVKVGRIIDVFGPACEPYYCVKPVRNCIEVVREGSEIFYSPGNPRTAFIRVKLTDKHRYTVMYSSTCPSGDRQEFAGQTRVEDFRRRISRDDYSDRKMYRRRRRHTSNHHRGASTCSNQYQPNQPKHLYFDY